MRCRWSRLLGVARPLVVIWAQVLNAPKTSSPHLSRILHSSGMADASSGMAEAASSPSKTHVTLESVLTADEITRFAGQDAGPVMRKGMPRADLAAREHAVRRGIVAHNAIWQMLQDGGMADADLPTYFSEAIRQATRNNKVSPNVQRFMYELDARANAAKHKLIYGEDVRYKGHDPQYLPEALRNKICIAQQADGKSHVVMKSPAGGANVAWLPNGSCVKLLGTSGRHGDSMLVETVDAKLRVQAYVRKRNLFYELDDDIDVRFLGCLRCPSRCAKRQRISLDVIH